MDDVKEIYGTIDGFVKIRDEKDLPLLIRETKFLAKRGFRSVCFGMFNDSIHTNRWILPDVLLESDDYKTFLDIPIKKAILLPAYHDSYGDVDLINKLKVDELDFILPYWEIKRFNYHFLKEILYYNRLRFDKHVLKAIIEAPVLNGREIMWITDLVASKKWDFVKTSTGRFGITLPRHIMLMTTQLSRSDPSGKIQVKAAGGIRGMRGWLMSIESGADVVGMSGYRELVKEAESDG